MDTQAEHLAKRARSFGAVAQLYDQARPSYPAELFAHLTGVLPGPRVLEVGAGTGKATAGLIAAGLEVTCVEPDPQMAAVLADRTADAPAPVRIEVETLESFAAPGVYDGLFSAQAWHWTDPATRMDRAAALLRPGGVLELVWNRGAILRQDAYDALQAVYDDFELAGRDRPRDPIGTAADLAALEESHAWVRDEMTAHPGFDYVGMSQYPWQRDYTAAEFTAFLQSTSHYQILGSEIRERLLAAVTALIRERFDDLITLVWSTQCCDARRLG